MVLNGISSIFKDDFNGLEQAHPRFFESFSLTIGFRNLRAPCNEPLSITFNRDRVFVLHGALHSN